MFVFMHVFVGVFVCRCKEERGREKEIFCLFILLILFMVLSKIIFFKKNLVAH